MFHEICIYEAKIEKQEEIEQLMREVKAFYLAQAGVIDVAYIKRSHRQADFHSVKNGVPPLALTRYAGKVTYALHWTLNSKETHAKLSQLGIEKFYKRWRRCLVTMPKIILGTPVE